MTRPWSVRPRRDGAALARGARLTGLLLSLFCAAAAGSLGAVSAAAAEQGDVVWRDFSQRVAGGADACAALAVSPTGAVVAAGSTTATPGATTDVLVRSYGRGGDVRWRRARTALAPSPPASTWRDSPCGRSPAPARAASPCAGAATGS